MVSEAVYPLYLIWKYREVQTFLSQNNSKVFFYFPWRNSTFALWFVYYKIICLSLVNDFISVNIHQYSLRLWWIIIINIETACGYIGCLFDQIFIRYRYIPCIGIYSQAYSLVKFKGLIILLTVSSLWLNTQSDSIRAKRFV